MEVTLWFWVGVLAGCCIIASLLVLANHGELMETFGKIGRVIVGPTGIFPTTGWIWQKETVKVREPTDPFLIDECCPACQGSGRLRFNLLADDDEEEQMWRELEREERRMKCLANASADEIKQMKSRCMRSVAASTLQPTVTKSRRP